MSKEIESSLPSLALVFGYIAIKELQSPNDRVEILERLGYGNREIATICGITESRVRRIKFDNRKKNKGKKLK